MNRILIYEKIIYMKLHRLALNLSVIELSMDYDLITLIFEKIMSEYPYS